LPETKKKKAHLCHDNVTPYTTHLGDANVFRSGVDGYNVRPQLAEPLRPEGGGGERNIEINPINDYIKYFR